MARRLLIAQAAVLTALGLGIFVKEIPGLIREIRIWRMVGLRGGPRRPR
ncbi:hypothetical protein [Streptantibioticus cattleyicolor]|uniref:Uncharacterized protein n=1 Tax=Streptantibioticus cattleyicolor (strain ATCC 35852 / DSM 46488 / JCM 4925 / NBRC 14057 / NRRL 8057) TaxID=1003195 RepID=F8JM38_STREN|nr:hypothetical protein [Streptantibioticus cattleyicolor]AEW99440.1 hypothetical protein SCATT_p12470 [Streptantibioticus cattleyicolor NRRL 8057 = DSM 46488]CCB71520.1 protein of unknown function [Streptantibioticus cattleyicolor NRRL 8057 = DSM 46488]